MFGGKKKKEEEKTCVDEDDVILDSWWVCRVVAGRDGLRGEPGVCVCVYCICV